MLYGQLQEGLRIGILRSPSVSGAMSYNELCMAAKNEEQRQTELRKCQDYSRPHNSFYNKGYYDKSTGDKSHIPSQYSKTLTGGNSGQVSGSGSSNTARPQQRWYLCNQPGHIAKYCKQSKTKEKKSTGNSSQRDMSVNSQVTTTNPTLMYMLPVIHEPFCFLTLTVALTLFELMTRAVSHNM